MTDLNDKLRADFEAHIKASPITGHWRNPGPAARGESGSYFYGHVNVAWEAWQAARATPAPQAAPSGLDLSKLRELVRQYSNTPTLGPGRTSNDVWNEIVAMLAAAPASLTPAPQGTASDDVTKLIAEIKAAKSMAWRDSLVEKLIVLLDAASLTQAATSEPVANLTITNSGASMMTRTAAGQRLPAGDYTLHLAAPAAAHPAPSDERAKFEAYARAQHNMRPKWDDEAGDYAGQWSKENWETWQAALSAQQAGPEERAKQDWNTQADQYNQWPELGQDEKDVLIKVAQQAGGQEAPRGERAAFEAWARSQGKDDRDLERCSGYSTTITGSDYSWKDVEGAWKSWQARAALSASPAVTNEDAKLKTAAEFVLASPRMSNGNAIVDRIRLAELEAALASQGVKGGDRDKG